MVKGFAQIPDSIQQNAAAERNLNGSATTDSTLQDQVKVDFSKDKKKFQPVPKKALRYSIIPGGGQIYNRSYWKLPIVYGALGTTAFFIVYNTREYHRYRDAIRIREDGDPMTKDEFTTDDCVELITTTQMRTFRDTKRKDMETSYIIFILTYTLTSVEAFVDAHLKSFDVSDDLSLRIKPTLNYLDQSPYPGLGLQFQLKNRSASPPPVIF